MKIVFFFFGLLLFSVSALAADKYAIAFLHSAKDLVGIPFVETPKITRNERHPTDLKKETNCAGVIIYALRKSGIVMPYLSARGLRLEMQKRKWEIAATSPVKTGDILHFGHQSAILAEDRPPLGTLSDEDFILHAYYAPVTIQKWKDVKYHTTYFEVYRVPNIPIGFGSDPLFTTADKLGTTDRKRGNR